MAIVVKCPDCGGVIGGSDSSGDSGDYPCTCHADEAAPSVPHGDATPAPARPALQQVDEFEEDDSPASSPPAPAALPSLARRPKVCCQCGCDLGGHRRYKDSRGYWCATCHKRDLAANKPQGERCGDCGRLLAPEKLSEFEGLRLCIRCIRERRDAEKSKIRYRVGDKHYRVHEAKRLVMLMLVFLFLLVLALLSHYGIIGEK